MLRGRPFSSTSTTGLPIACTALSSSSCRPGKSSEPREANSPAMSAFSPSTMIDLVGGLGGGHGRMERRLGIFRRLERLALSTG
jgi:hypothetical protein